MKVTEVGGSGAFQVPLWEQTQKMLEGLEEVMAQGSVIAI